jgi:Ulp1 family protease
MFQSNSYSFDDVKRWANQVKGGDIFKLGLLFVPVNVNGSHWTLCVADIPNKVTPPVKRAVF